MDPDPAAGEPGDGALVTRAPGALRSAQLLIAGRIAVALVAVIVLAATGWEWAIKSRADSGIISRSVQAIVTDDTNIATATGTAAPPGSYAPENILLLGSDTRSGANGERGQHRRQHQ